MGLIRNLANRKKEKKQSKKVKKVLLLLASKKILIEILAISTIILTIGGFFTWLIEHHTAEETPKTILEELEIEKLGELVTIKGNEADGFHLELIEGFDEKLDKLTEVLARRGANRSFSEKDKKLLKKMMKAELVTEFPDLGGKLESDNENQFQGAITVRRITPNKAIGEIKATGSGEKTTEQDLKVDNTQKEEITYEKGQELKVRETTKVYLKGEYNFLGEKKSEEGITSKVSTILSKIEGVNRTINVGKGDIVYYTGNTFSYENNTYIEIAEQKESEEVIGYIKNIYVEVPKIIINESNQEQNNKQEEKVPTKTIGDGSKEFVIAIAAGHNASDDKGYSDGTWVEEELTIQVAEQVESLFKDYTNIKVVQTGSTRQRDVKKEERTQLAKEANPDLCIQIYFNSGNEQSGVEACYEYGDGKSEKLATLLTEKIANKMGLEDKGAISFGGTSDFYDIIDSSMQTGFPSVITKGCFLDNKKDQEVLRNGGVSQYAKGIVEACEEYLKNDKGDDTVTNIEQNDTYSRIESRIYDLQYVDPETFNKYVEEANERALEVYTLSEEFNLITATWEIKGEKFSVNKNAEMNFRNILKRVSMPYEYLLYFLIDSENKKFVEELADTVINDTEIIIAVQDNITTTEINTTVQQRTIITQDTGKEAKGEDWHNTSLEYEVSETCSTPVEITYANTWFMKFTKGETYSSESLKVNKHEKVDVIKNVKGKVNDTKTRTEEGWNNDNSGGIKIGGGISYYESLKKGGTTKEEDATGNNVEKHKYSYEIYQRKEIITHKISNNYEQGESNVKEEGNKFKKLYKKHKMKNSINVDWLTDIMTYNEKTVNLIDLTKYMIFLSTRVDTGVTDLDFSIFNLTPFTDTSSSMGGLDTFVEYLHAWEGHAGISEDGTKYRVGDDGAGHPTVGYGIDIYNSGFLDRFIAAGYDVSIGAYIDIEFVDALEKEEIQNNIQTVEAKCAGLNLTQYQKYALVSRTYNCGSSGAFWSRNGKDFVTAYSTYWNQERDDAYQIPWHDSLYDHSLYTTYMSGPTTSGGKFLQGLKNRRESEWKLFRTGYYDRIDKWCSTEGGGGSATSALDALPNYNAGTSSGFGYRNHPVSGGYVFHQGTDIAAPSGTEIAALGSGEVRVMEFNSARGFYIIIDHKNGYETVYQHCSAFADGLNVGSTVQQGQIIAYVGSTGISTGAHLHLEILTAGGTGEHSSYFSGYDVVNPETFDYSKFPG